MKLVIALAFAAPLFGQPPCTYVVSPLDFRIGAELTTGTVRVSGSTSCGDFTATVPTQTPWLHIDSGSAGTPGGPGVTFTADANPLPIPRSGEMFIALQKVTVTQAGRTDCVFGLPPSGQTIPASGGQALFFRVQANCPWQATKSFNWITFAGAISGTSDGTVVFSAAANPCVDGRSGIVTLQTNLPKPPTLAIVQAGSPDNLSLSAYNVTVPSAPGTGHIDLRTGNGCPWAAYKDVNWILITVGSSGTGNGLISYNVLENTAVRRTGNIHVGATLYTITQEGPAAPPMVLSAVTNAANYNTDAVSPGEILALFGNSLGPAKIALPDVSNGTYPSSLAGTQVLFDGVAAPMIYTLNGQVSAIVPYTLGGVNSTRVQVQYQGVVSNTLTMPVRAATPAIFSLDKTGMGPGAILNQDNSLNSTGNPAARLSVISLYCTGGGITAPATTDGEVVGQPLRRLTQTTAVTIGGVNATVQYAGAAPGAVAGLTQINVEVPAGLAPALALPVVVKIGDFTSGNAITVAVK